MSTMAIFNPKDVIADVFLNFDFISMLESGETIVGAAVSAEVFSGTDPNPAGMISGAEVLTGTIVSQKMIDGIAGVIYLVNCTVTTDLVNIKTMQGYLAVVDTNPFEA